MNDKPLNDMQETYRQAECDGMVKVGIPCHPSTGITLERCWAKRLSASYARLDNVCLFQDGVGFGDVVEFREQAEPHAILKEFVRVISRGSIQTLVVYATRAEAADDSDGMRQELSDRRKDIHGFLEALFVRAATLVWEHVKPGVLCSHDHLGKCIFNPEGRWLP